LSWLRLRSVTLPGSPWPFSWALVQDWSLCRAADINKSLLFAVGFTNGQGIVQQFVIVVTLRHHLAERGAQVFRLSCCDILFGTQVAEHQYRAYQCRHAIQQHCLVADAFAVIEGEGILFLLNKAGIAAVSSSSCTSGSLEPSHVMKAMGIPYTAAHGTVRFSLSRYNTMDEIERVIEAVLPIAEKLRKLSPYCGENGPVEDPEQIFQPKHA
jgi:selenocysteine lyase/cysteine desulfurase